MREVLERIFGAGGRIAVAAAPGRVNLIGEHTDYNEGFVLPMAIGLGVRAAGRARADREVRVHAADLGETVAFGIDGAAGRDPVHPWSDYVRGVLWALRRAGVPLAGMDLAFGGDLPQGAGLGSSAALEVSIALVAGALAGLDADRPRLARLCQQAENEHVGTQCGIMDQLASLMGRAGHALLLDCRTLEVRHVPLALGDHVVAVCHSGVKHALVGSGYNQRRRECAAGVEVLRARFPGVRALRDATPEQVESCRAELAPEVHRRCRHVVTEDVRVLESVAALRAGDLGGFGRLMDASHDSQRDDFEVSCPEVDLLVDLARRTPGVLGARMTGGGFGGCTVNLVARDRLDAFRETVLDPYRRQTGIAPRLFVSAASDGATVS